MQMFILSLLIIEVPSIFGFTDLNDMRLEDTQFGAKVKEICFLCEVQNSNHS